MLPGAMSLREALRGGKKACKCWKGIHRRRRGQARGTRDFLLLEREDKVQPPTSGLLLASGVHAQGLIHPSHQTPGLIVGVSISQRENRS